MPSRFPFQSVGAAVIAALIWLVPTLVRAADPSQEELTLVSPPGETSSLILSGGNRSIPPDGSLWAIICEVCEANDYLHQDSYEDNDSDGLVSTGDRVGLNGIQYFIDHVTGVLWGAEYFQYYAGGCSEGPYGPDPSSDYGCHAAGKSVIEMPDSCCAPGAESYPQLLHHLWPAALTGCLMCEGFRGADFYFPSSWSYGGDLNETGCLDAGDILFTFLPSAGHGKSTFTVQSIGYAIHVTEFGAVPTEATTWGRVKVLSRER